MITTSEERRHNMEKMGIDYLVEYPFTDDVRKMDPSVFCKGYLGKRMQAKAMVVGAGLQFWLQRRRKCRTSQIFKKELGFELYVIQKEKDHRRDISSTYIREELSLGNVAKANELLGEPYAIHGIVVHGNHIGDRDWASNSQYHPAGKQTSAQIRGLCIQSPCTGKIL